MKKLLFATLALGLALGSVSFAQQTPDSTTSQDSTGKKAKKHKKNKKSSSTSTNKM